MNALVLTDTGMQLQDIPAPKRRSGEALINVHVAGICSTDLELAKGYMHFRGTLGHEFVGTVVEADTQQWIGQRVVATINIAPPSQSQDSAVPAGQISEHRHTPGRSVLGILHRDGAMAQQVCVPEENLRGVDAGVSDRQAVFAEPLAAAMRITEQLRVSPSDKVAVIGPGRLGMLVSKVLSLGGANVTVIGRNTASLELPARWQLPTQLDSQVVDGAFDMVVEATGNPDVLALAFGALRPLGTLVLKSTYAQAANVDLTPVVVNEINVVGSRCGPMTPALRLLSQHRINVEELIDAEYPLGRALSAFQHAARPGVRKVLLQCL